MTDETLKALKDASKSIEDMAVSFTRGEQGATYLECIEFFALYANTIQAALTALIEHYKGGGDEIWIEPRVTSWGHTLFSKHAPKNKTALKYTRTPALDKLMEDLKDGK